MANLPELPVLVDSNRSVGLYAGSIVLDYSPLTSSGMTGRRRKPAQGDALPFKGEFSFVNKDASNIASKDHNAAVSWHVVNRYEKWKKQEQMNTGKPSGRVPASPRAAAAASRAIVSHAIPTCQPTWTSLTLLPQQEEQRLQTPYPPEPWQMRNAEQSMLTQSTQTQSSSSLPSSVSPFDVRMSGSIPNAMQAGSVNLQGTPLELAHFPPLVERILAYAYGTVVPMTWPNDNGRMKWTYEVSRTWDDLAMITADSCYAASTLCFYATLMASATNDADIASQACFFQTQAMSELRQRVTSPPGGYEPATLHAILRLFSAETALDNTSTARVHLKMLRTIVSAEGGVILLDSWFRENLLCADCYFALKYETRPLFPASEWTPGPLSQPWKARLSSARIFADHASTVDPVLEGPLKTVIADIRELFRVERYVNSHDLPFDDQLLRWCQLRKFDCISRLADHQLSVKIYPHLFERPKLQLATCAAVAMMSAIVLGSPEPIRFGLKLIDDLHVKLIDAEIELGQETDATVAEDMPDATNLLFWIVHVGALAEQTHPAPHERAWFQRQFQTRSLQLTLQTREEQENIVKQFLFSSTVADEIAIGRASREVEVKKGVYEACGMTWRQPLESIEGSLIESETEALGPKGKKAMP